jgi:hypothetical protein
MIRKGYLLLILIWIGFNHQVQAQRSAKPSELSDRYKTFNAIGLTTNTNAGIIGGAYFKHSSSLRSSFRGQDLYQYLAVELVNVKHPKEIVTTDFVTGRFIQYKQNYLFALRPEYGREISLFNRNEEEGITVSAVLAVGPTIGLVKPYMVKVQEGQGRISTVPFDPEKLSSGSSVGIVVGPGGFFNGFGQTKIVPGLHIKAALNFELSAFRENITGVEIGFLGETYTKKIELMAYAPNRSFYPSGFITLYFGNKKR